MFIKSYVLLVHIPEIEFAGNPFNPYMHVIDMGVGHHYWLNHFLFVMNVCKTSSLLMESYVFLDQTLPFHNKKCLHSVL